MPDIEPSAANNYQVAPSVTFNRARWNAVMLSIAQRLAAREALEASFVALVAQGTQDALDLIGQNVAPQLEALIQQIAALEVQLDEILGGGNAANSLRLGGELPSYYLALANATGTLAYNKVAGIDAAIAAAVAALVNGSPAALDTIRELADALGGDAAFSTTVLTALAKRLRFDAAQTLTSGEMTQLWSNAGISTKLLPTGTEIMVVGTSAPAGTLKENGALYSRTTYADLWAYAQASGALVSEATWAAGSRGCFSVGDGSTTFRVPEVRGEFIRAWDDGRGIDASRGIGTEQTDLLKAHNHPITDVGHAHAGGDYGHGHVFGQTLDAGPYSTGSHLTGHGGNLIDGSPYQINTGYANIVVYGATTGITVQNTGGAETRPRNISRLACIKY